MHSKEHFASNDQLLTLALAAGINKEQWELAREVGARITVHVNGTGQLLPFADALGSDVTCIHCTRLLKEEWQLLADTGAGVSSGLMTVQDILKFATVQGARDNGLEEKTGSLTPGKDADLILLRKDMINVMPVNNAYGAVVLMMDTSNVDTVFISGKIKKWKGELTGIDFNRINRSVHESRDYIVSKTGWNEILFGKTIG